MGTPPEPSRYAHSPIEAALRYLGTRSHGIPVELLAHAIDRPLSSTAAVLKPLTERTAVLDDWTAAERATALWQVIETGIVDPEVSRTRLSRRRWALRAAFRLPDTDIREPWGASLTQRFKQLRVLKDVFNEPMSTQPMEMAWKRGVGALAGYLQHRFDELSSPAEWAGYRPARSGHQVGIHAIRPAETGFREPSEGAQPIFAELFITTVFMRRQAVYRRITERLVTARSDGIEYYTARGFAGWRTGRTHVPVRALWGCRAEFVESPHPRQPPVTRLWFPTPLRLGEQAHFASEVIDENITAERDWVDVDIDHHGIARGGLLYDGRVPVSGLTIRIRFDEGHLPEAVWWYAEMNERERLDRPQRGDRRLLAITGHDVQHTFEQACQPRESYGLAFSWPGG